MKYLTQKPYKSNKLQAKAKRKVGPAKVVGSDGAVKDETKETREKVKKSPKSQMKYVVTEY